MGYRHGWPTSDGVVVEAHKPMRAEAFEDCVDRRLAEYSKILARHPSAENLGPFTDRDHAQQHLTGDVLLVSVEASIDVLRPAAERSCQPPDFVVRRRLDGAMTAPFVHLCQRVLQQWERVRMPGDISHDLRNQASVEPDADSLGWTRDRPLHFVW